MANEIENESAARNLKIRQTWLEEQSIQIESNYGYESPEKAFQALSISLLFNLDYDAIQPDEIVDGGQDKQIDVIRIEDDADRGEAHIHIIQAKMTDGFSSNVVIQMRNGLGWIFERPKAEYQTLDNPALVNKIDEIRELRLSYGASNLTVSVYFITLGDAQNLSKEFLQERKILVDSYSNVGFSNFIFREIGAYELYQLLNESEKAERQIDVDIPIMYDVNRASLIQYTTGDTKALICTISGKDLARIASIEPRDAIFDLNVRPYYGSRGQVNNEILKTSTGLEASRFWFLNNGITMTCDHFDLIPDPDNTIVKVRNAQIVNGCQTSVTLREAWEKKLLKEEVRVLLRIYSTDNPNLAGRITLTTNNQNRITDRDLRANDDVQIDIQRIMKDRFDFYYERKNKQYRGMRGDQRNRLVPNYKAAQAYLSIVRKKPSVARGYLGKIWSDYYKEIFENATVEDLLTSFLIYKHCAKNARSMFGSLGKIESEVAVYGAFHIARVIGYYLARDNWGGKNREVIASLARDLIKSESTIEPVYQKSKGLIVEIRKENRKTSQNPTLYFKAGDVQKSIAKKIEEL